MPRHSLENHVHSNLEGYFKKPNPNDTDLLPVVGETPTEPPKRKEILITADNITFLEGSTMTPQVCLSVAPSNNVTVTITNSNLEIGVTPTTLTFTPSNYSKYQAITVSGNRSDSQGDLTSTITLSAKGGEYDGVSDKQISVKMLEEGSTLPPSTEYVPVSNGDFICPNGDISISNGSVTLNSASTYGMVQTVEGITGIEGVLEFNEPHAVVATNGTDTVVSVYLKGESRMLFKTVNGSATSLNSSLSTLSSIPLDLGNTFKIEVTESGVCEVSYKDSVQGNVSLSELTTVSGVSNLRFAFGFISNVSGKLLSNVKVLGGKNEGGGEEPDPPKPPVEEGDPTPIGDVIDTEFTTSTSSLGNNVSYNLDNNMITFTKTTSDRHTVFTKPLSYLKFEVLKPLDWLTVFSNSLGDQSYGIYANNPSGFGYVTFQGFSGGGYSFSSNKPSFEGIVVGDVVELIYTNNTCVMKVNDTTRTTIDTSIYSTTDEFIPRIGFKIDANVVSAPHSLVKILKGTANTSTFELFSEDYGYGVTQKLERAIDHIKYLYTKIDGGSTQTNPFKNKNASAIGDSITADNSYLNPLKTKLELNSIQNLAIGGQGYTGGNFLNQVPSISSTSKLIILSGGVNDFRVNKPLGTPQDMDDVNTFYGALYLTFKKVAELHSDKKVVVATFHNNKEHIHTMYPAWDKPNSTGKYAWDYIDAMKQRAKMFGFPVADVYGESGINVQDHCTTDGIHLNADGGSRMAEIIKNTILTKPYYRF